MYNRALAASAFIAIAMAATNNQSDQIPNDETVTVRNPTDFLGYPLGPVQPRQPLPVDDVAAAEEALAKAITAAAAAKAAKESQKLRAATATAKKYLGRPRPSLNDRVSVLRGDFDNYDRLVTALQSKLKTAEAELAALDKAKATNVQTASPKAQVEDLKTRLEIAQGGRIKARDEWFKAGQKLSTQAEGLKKEMKQLQATVDRAADSSSVRSTTAKISKLKRKLAKLVPVKSADAPTEVDMFYHASLPTSLAGRTVKETDVQLAAKQYADQHVREFHSESTDKLTRSVENAAERWAKNEMKDALDKKGDKVLVPQRPLQFEAVVEEAKKLRDAAADQFRLIDGGAIIRRKVAGAEGDALAAAVISSVDFSKLTPAYFAKRWAERKSQASQAAAGSKV